MAKATMRALDLARVPPRLALAASMLYHGRSKLFGQAPKQTAEFFGQLDIRPSRPWTIATGLTELTAGILALLGIGTRPAALAVLVTQAVAVAKVHRPHGYDMVENGYEYNLTLMAIALGLLVAGPGSLSMQWLAWSTARGRPRIPFRSPERLLTRLLRALC